MAAAAALVLVNPSDWPAYAVLFVLLTALDLFWIDIAPPVPIGLPYMATLLAFVYIAGLPVLAVQAAVWPLSLRLMRILARRGIFRPPLHIAALVRQGRASWGPERYNFYLARFYGTVGVLSRYAAFRAASVLLPDLDFLLRVALAEAGGYLGWGLALLVLPMPAGAASAEPARAQRQRDLVRASLLCLPPLVFFILYGYRVHGLAGAAGCALASILFHFLAKEMNSRRLEVEAANADLTAATRALRERSEHLREINRALAEKARALSEKQEELRAFVYTLTHDLKNPLSAILLSADLVLARWGERLDVEGREDLERIVRLAGRTEEMIGDLLGLFRITSTPEPRGWVDLGALVGRALESLGPQIARKGVQVKVGSLPRVWGQEEKLAHVVENLLGNAVKYVPAGRGEVEVSGELGDGEALLCVRDNGVGIPAAYHERIFELFRQVPEEEQRVAEGPAGGGTGVGLAVVKRVVEGHGGRVWVSSTPGAGSCFYVWLPAREGHRAEEGER